MNYYHIVDGFVTRVGLRELQIKLLKYVTDRPGHDFRYAIDSSKLNNRTRVEAVSFQFEEGIEKTVAWYIKQ